MCALSLELLDVTCMGRQGCQGNEDIACLYDWLLSVSMQFTHRLPTSPIKLVQEYSGSAPVRLLITMLFSCYNASGRTLSKDMDVEGRHHLWAGAPLHTSAVPDAR